MVVEKRVGMKAVPENLADHLNDLQREILAKISKFGWSLMFVRRPSGEEPTVVITDQDGKKFGVMGTEGYINFDTGILIRGNQVCE